MPVRRVFVGRFGLTLERVLRIKFESLAPVIHLGELGANGF